MPELHADLLSDSNPLFGNAIFNATVEGHGLYNTLQFVLRLSPIVHRKLASMPSGIVNSGMIDFEGIEAFSTYLHETIHWWQHIGSTYGLMLSMTYPAQAQMNYVHLKNLIAKVGFKKSTRKLAETLPAGGIGTPGGLANIIINNHFDMDAFWRLTVNPLKASDILQSPLFESLGHCYLVAYGNIITLLSSASDRDHNVIPNPKTWGESYRALRDAKEEGYYYGSPVSLCPIGAYEIFEGQARMAQLQYMHFATGGILGLEAADGAKMLNGVYGKAFSTFLYLTELKRPSSIDDPAIALFLLICDLAINPGSGFPFPVIHFKTFMGDIEPGARFVSMCRLARLKCPDIFETIQTYSRDEYEAVSKKLCEVMMEHPPLEIAREFCRWTETPEFQPLMAEHKAFRFGKDNVAVRVLFSHFLAFMRDKLARPEFFCWPGVYMAGDQLASDAITLFDRHGALFIDKEDDDGVYPRLPSGRKECDVQEAFDDFYANNVIYDLTHQWITQPGSFKYAYRWLSQKGSDDEIQSFAEGCFELVYGVKPKSVVVL